MTRLICIEGGSRKFWEGWVYGTSLIVRWGKVGRDGRTQKKSFADAAAATKELNRLLAEKRGKGYLAEVGSASLAKRVKTPASLKGAEGARPTQKAYRALVLARLAELRTKLIKELRERVFPRTFPPGTTRLDYEIFSHGFAGPLPIAGYVMADRRNQVMIRNARGKVVSVAPNVEVLKSVDPVIPPRLVQQYEDAGIDTLSIDRALVRAWFVDGWKAAGGKRLFPLGASIQYHDGDTQTPLPSASRG